MKKTLYDTLKETYEKQGFIIEEDSWIESVGYKKPTQEYWFDVQISIRGNKRITLHYFFIDNKNVLDSFNMYTSDLVLEDIYIEKIF